MRGLGSLVGMMLVLLPVSHAGASAPGFDMQYAEFIDAFHHKHWEHVCRFVTERTQTGFGPGEAGCEALRQQFSDPSCWQEMVSALRQGCQQLPSSKGERCIAPPQFNDDQVLYVGSRAGFSLDSSGKKLLVDFLICGGD